MLKVFMRVFRVDVCIKVINSNGKISRSGSKALPGENMHGL